MFMDVSMTASNMSPILPPFYSFKIVVIEIVSQLMR